MGCSLEIDKFNGNIVVKGNTCKRGNDYGISEFTAPKRVVTSLVKIRKGGVLACKTDRLIDKNKIFDVLNCLKDFYLDDVVPMGTVVIENISDSGANIVITSEPNKIQ
jgi:CxxC motif-containing protein